MKIKLNIKNEGWMAIKNNLQLKTTIEDSINIGIQNIKNRYKLLTQREVVIDKSQSTFCIEVPLLTQKEFANANIDY